MKDDRLRIVPTGVLIQEAATRYADYRKHLIEKYGDNYKHYMTDVEAETLQDYYETIYIYS